MSASYFDTMGVALIDGQAFTDADGFDRPGMAVVNDAFARRVEGRGDRAADHEPIAPQHVGPSAPNEFTIVGVAENERFRGLEEPSEPAVYLSARQFPQGGVSLLVRTSSPDALAASLRSIIREVEPRLSVDVPDHLANILAAQLTPRRLTTDVPRWVRRQRCSLRELACMVC